MTRRLHKSFHHLIRKQTRRRPRSSMHARIPVIVHEADEGGYWAEVPALPGCFTQAETLGELKKNVQIAVNLYIEDNEDYAAQETETKTPGDESEESTVDQATRMRRPPARRQSS